MASQSKAAAKNGREKVTAARVRKPATHSRASLAKESPRFVEPMKARLQYELPSAREWVFEWKLDGIRAIGVKSNRKVQLFSRLPRNLSPQYPTIVSALDKLPARQLVVDGEIVALDKTGRPSFQLLQNRKRNNRSIHYYIFDLLNLDGHDLKPLPLTQRRQALECLLAKASSPLRFSASLKSAASRIWKQATALGLEGVIAKRKNSMYEPGRRSGAWIKIKVQNEQEFVIGGYTAPDGSRKYFGSLMVGYYQGHNLLFVSRVGTGFDSVTLRDLHRLFQRYRITNCPFSNLPTARTRRSGRGITASDMARCVWLKPALVCQVRFLEWTEDGSLRQPVFLGVRDDKKPREVVRERVV